MEKFLSNPGFQHLIENIFWNLDFEDLKMCAQINQSCKEILKHPIFCLAKFQHLSNKNRKDWMIAIKSLRNPDKGIAIISYLKWNFKKETVDPPCYSSSAVQDDFRKKIWECCLKKESSDEAAEIVKMLAPLTYDLDTSNEWGETPISLAACKGHTKIVKILAPLTENPNASDIYGETPINFTQNKEILSILKPYKNSAKRTRISED